MSRLTFAALQASINALLPDNTTGDISPADVRNTLQNIIDTYQPAGTGINGIPPVAVTLNTTTPTKLTIFDQNLQQLGGAGITPDSANDLVTTTLVGVHQVAVSVSVSGPNNSPCIVYIFRDGVNTNIGVEITCRGAGNTNELSFVFPFQAVSPGPHTFDVRATGSGSHTFSNAVFTVEYVPGQ